MVKINQTNDSLRPLQSIGTPSRDTKTDAFKSALDKALDKTGSSRMDTSLASALDEIPSKNLTFTPVPSDISERTDQLLQMLDKYSSQLEDPDVSLRKIAPVLEEIKTYAGHILEEADASPDMSSKLKRIAKEVAITANIEYFKFQRGDYLS